MNNYFLKLIVTLLYIFQGRGQEQQKPSPSPIRYDIDLVLKPNPTASQEEVKEKIEEKINEKDIKEKVEKIIEEKPEKIDKKIKEQIEDIIDEKPEIIEKEIIDQIEDIIEEKPKKNENEMMEQIEEIKEENPAKEDDKKEAEDEEDYCEDFMEPIVLRISNIPGKYLTHEEQKKFLKLVSDYIRETIPELMKLDARYVNQMTERYRQKDGENHLLLLLDLFGCFDFVKATHAVEEAVKDDKYYDDDYYYKKKKHHYEYDDQYYNDDYHSKYSSKSSKGKGHKKYYTYSATLAPTAYVYKAKSGKGGKAYWENRPTKVSSTTTDIEDEEFISEQEHFQKARTKIPWTYYPHPDEKEEEVKPSTHFYSNLPEQMKYKVEQALTVNSDDFLEKLKSSTNDANLKSITSIRYYNKELPKEFTQTQRDANQEYINYEEENKWGFRNNIYKDGAKLVPAIIGLAMGGAMVLGLLVYLISKRLK